MQRPILIAVAVLILGAMHTACSKMDSAKLSSAESTKPVANTKQQESTPTATPPHTTQPLGPKPFQNKLYRTLDDKTVITVISDDELEIRERGENFLCKYSVAENRLRVVMTVLGTQRVLYFETIETGLRAEDGTLFYNLTAYQAAKKELLAEKDLHCSNNLKQLALGVMMYASDHQELFPSLSTWSDLVYTYTQSTKCCECVSEAKQRYGYAMNRRLDGKKTSDVSDPAKTVMMFGSREGKNNAGGPELAVSHPHSDSDVMLVFCDAHVEAVPISRLNSLRWAPSGGEGSGP